MIYIYDILLNFCDCEMLYDFYEWSTNDTVENIKRIKLVHIEKEEYNNLLYYNGTIDNNFLIKVYRTCEVYTNKKVKTIDYCALFSDGNRVMAIEFNNKGKPIYKSKLLIDEEEEISILASNLEKYNLTFKLADKVLNNRYFTRNEIFIQKYLLKEISECYNQKNFDKLHFLYAEYFEEEETVPLKMYHSLLKSIETTIDDKHLNLYKILRLSNKKKQV